MSLSLGPIKSTLYTSIDWYRTHKLVLFHNEIAKDTVVANNIPVLPPKVAHEVNSFWRKYVNHDIGLYYHRIAALSIPAEKLPFVVSDSVLCPFIIKKLNPEERSSSLSDKGMYNVIFSDVKRPSEIVRNIRGNFLDNGNELIDRTTAIRKIQDYNKPIIIKPSVGSYGGDGVKIINSLDETNIGQTFDLYKTDFVVQELLKQSPQTARFNPTSLNTFRILSLLLNGHYSLLGAWLKCGGKDSVVDNLTCGGMASCIAPEGKMSYGISVMNPRIETSPTGKRFENCQIEHFDRILRSAEQLHRRIPSMAMVGWDFALDIYDEPVFIEANLLRPDTWPWQMTQGPIFGDRLQEVLDFCFPDIK